MQVNGRDAAFPPIPVFRPSVGEEEIAAVCATLRSGWLGSGPRARAFERAFAEYTGAGYAVATVNCTGALLATLAALGVGPGDEVIMPSMTWPSIFQMVSLLGATPVFADIEPVWLTLDAEDVRRRVTARTRGIVVVHHGGQCADLEALQQVADEAGVWLVDDAAHACGTVAEDGRRIGCHTRATCFSFNAVKNLCAGDGGMVTTNDEELARRIRVYASLGLDRDTFSRYGPGTERNADRWRFELTVPGARLHMNDIVATLGLAQLERLDERNECRAERAARYLCAFDGVAGLRFVGPKQGTEPSWHMMTVLLDERDRFIEEMSLAGVAVGVHYHALHQFQAARDSHCELPVTEVVSRRTATLPLYPDLSRADQDRVIEAALRFVEARPKRKAARA